MISNPVIFPVGRTTLSWLREGGKPDRGFPGMLLLYRWHAFWFEFNLRLSNADLREAGQLPPPVFIVGMWRSGTTFLHDLMSANRMLVAPTTWQCMNASLHALHASKGASVQRPMDSLTIGHESPQEDEFALLAMGVPSAYRAFLDPRRMLETEQWLNPDTWVNLPSDCWLPSWRNFLAGVQKGLPGRLLLKSPNHTFRVPAILRHFPNAQFVWMLRDPEEVILSNIQMWTSMIRYYALWKMDDNTLTQTLNHFLESALSFSAATLEHAIANLPSSRLVVVQFQDLARSPAASVAMVHQALNLPIIDLDQAKVSGLVNAAAQLPRARYDDSKLGCVQKPLLERLHRLYDVAVKSHGMSGFAKAS